MLNILMPDIMPEFKVYEAKNHHFLKINIGKLYNERFMIENEKHLWLPMLCILSARIIKNANIKTYQLAEIFHLLSYAVQFHWSLPENNQDCKEDLKNAVLCGDLIYSRIYTNICQYGLQDYLLRFSSLISNMNESLILSNYLRGDNAHEIGVYASLTQSACSWGCSTATNNQQVLYILREYGYNLGILKGVYDKGENIDMYYYNWQKCWDRADELVFSKKNYFKKILRHMGEKWEVEKPALIQKNVI